MSRETIVQIIIWFSSIGFIIGLIMTMVGLIMQTVWQRKLTQFDQKYEITHLTERERLQKRMRRHLWLAVLWLLIFLFGLVTYIFMFIAVIALVLLIYSIYSYISLSKKLKVYDMNHSNEIQIMQQKLSQLSPEETKNYQTMTSKITTYLRIAKVGLLLMLLMGLLWYAFILASPDLKPVTGA